MAELTVLEGEETVELLGASDWGPRFRRRVPASGNSNFLGLDSSAFSKAVDKKKIEVQAKAAGITLTPQQRSSPYSDPELLKKLGYTASKGNFLEQTAKAATGLVKSSANIAKATVAIPAQLIATGNVSRAVRRTGSTLSESVRAPTHFALEATRATPIIGDIERKIQREVEKLVRKIALQKLFTSGTMSGDDPISKYSRSSAKSYIMPFAVAGGTSLGATIGSAVPGYGTAVGGAAGAAAAGTIVPVVVDKIFDEFEGKKNKAIANGVPEDKAAAAAASSTKNSLNALVNGPGILIVAAVAVAAYLYYSKNNKKKLIAPSTPTK